MAVNKEIKRMCEKDSKSQISKGNFKKGNRLRWGRDRIIVKGQEVRIKEDDNTFRSQVSKFVLELLRPTNRTPLFLK